MHPVSLTGEILPPQRDERGYYLPGNSGNPGGMSEAKREMQELARRHSVEAIERAVEIMRTGLSGNDDGSRLPVPRQQFIQSVSGMSGDAGEDVRQPSLRIDAIHLGRDDETVHRGGTPTAAIGPAEQPGFSAESNAAQPSFGGVV